jgi:hypothetical protein
MLRRARPSSRTVVLTVTLAKRKPQKTGRQIAIQ